MDGGYAYSCNACSAKLFIALASIVAEDDREEVAPAEGSDDDVEVMQSSAVDDVDAAKPAGGSAGATAAAEAAADTASRSLQDREALFDILKVILLSGRCSEISTFKSALS